MRYALHPIQQARAQEPADQICVSLHSGKYRTTGSGPKEARYLATLEKSSYAAKRVFTAWPIVPAPRLSLDWDRALKSMPIVVLQTGRLAIFQRLASLVFAL